MCTSTVVCMHFFFFSKLVADIVSTDQLNSSSYFSFASIFEYLATGCSIFIECRQKSQRSSIWMQQTLGFHHVPWSLYIYRGYEHFFMRVLLWIEWTMFPKYIVLYHDLQSLLSHDPTPNSHYFPTELPGFFFIDAVYWR